MTHNARIQLMARDALTVRGRHDDLAGVGDTAFINVTDGSGAEVVHSGTVGQLRRLVDAMDALVREIERGNRSPEPFVCDPTDAVAKSYEQPDRALRDAWLEHLEQRRVPTASTWATSPVDPAVGDQQPAHHQTGDHR